MTPSCFINFAKTYLKEFTVRGITFTGEGNASLDSWSRNLKLALKKFPSDIVIGHSFGGMLLLSTRGLDKLVKGQVILSASPDLSWHKNADKINLSKSESIATKLAELKFKKNPTPQSLKQLWKSWAPYYFSTRNRAKGRLWLWLQNYELKAHRSSEKLLANYSMLNPATLPTLFIGGKQDKLTPVAAFKKKLLGKNYIGLIREIPRAGHFCWLDAPKRTASKLCY